jgi:hypothetical protein
MSCKNGYFLINGRCEKKCPMGFKADRITWECVDDEGIREYLSLVFGWYWVDPSVTSCRGFCNKYNSECSCEDRCIQDGNCCADFDEFCSE